MFKKFLMLTLAVLFSLGQMWGATYKLTKVSSVSAGKKYVFVQDTHAFGSTVSSKALQTVTGYNTTGLAGTESYVWTLETATGGFYMKNVSLQSNQYLNNSSSTTVSFGSASSIWAFDFTDVNAVLIQNKSNSSRYLGYTSATSYVYKAYATSDMSYPHGIKVYVLEEETGSNPTCSTPTITFAEGENVEKLTTDAAFTNAASVEYESTATGQTISWSVEAGKDGVATVNTTTGEVTIVGAGVAKIYASAAAEGDYCEKDAYYTLTVAAPVVPFAGKTWSVTASDLVILDNTQSSTYAKYAGTQTKDGIDYNVAAVMPNSGNMQMQKTNGVIYNETSFGKIAKVTVASSNSFKMYEGAAEAPSATEVTGVAANGVITYDFSGNNGYFKLVNATNGAATVSEIKVYYYPIKSTITLATCENGSVSVNGIADLTQVEAGTEVTLTNEPASGYKLTAYDVYKTGDATKKVTVSDGKFTMPDYAVTVSATFEEIKVLDHIELNTDNVTKVFWKGESFNYKNLVVTAYYDNQTSATVTPKSVSAPNMTLFGQNQTITVSYQEGEITKTATYEIIVKTIANTQATAYSATEAKALYDAGKDLASLVYVQGIVSKMYSTSLPTDGTLSFYVSENGTESALQFEFYKTYKAANKTQWTSVNDVQVGDTVVGYGKLTYYSRGDVYEFDGTTESYLVYHERPVVLQSIELNTDDVKKTYKIGSDDVFSAENLVVTAHYNVATEDKTIDLANVNFSGYDMTVANTYTVTVSYTENGVTKTATYDITVLPNCENLATITLGTTENGTFDLSVKGQQCAEGDGVSTVLTATPAEHYHLASVTATVGTVGEIEGNTCTISDITADATITAVFEEDAKGTATFVAGAAEATGTAPTAITEYVGDEITLPANTFKYVGYQFVGWKLNETTYQVGDEFTMVEGGAEFTAQWEALPVWATTYTSNVEMSSNENKSVKIDGETYAAVKTNKGTTAVVTIPAGTTELHFHAAAWKDEAQTITLSGTVVNDVTFAIEADASISGTAGTYELAGDPTEDYYSITLSGVVAETSLTFSAATSKRFILYGVNVVVDNKLAVVGAASWGEGNTYTTNTELGKHGTICLPYNCTVSGAVIYDENPTRVEGGLEFVEAGNEVYAGHAYIYFATADVQTWTRKDEDEAVDVVEGNLMEGTYAQITLLNNEYFLHTTDEYFHPAGNNVVLPAFRACIPDMPEFNGAPVRLIMPKTGVATGVENAADYKATKALVNGKLVILRGAKSYNVAGQAL